MGGGGLLRRNAHKTRVIWLNVSYRVVRMSAVLFALFIHTHSFLSRSCSQNSFQLCSRDQLDSARENEWIQHNQLVTDHISSHACTSHPCTSPSLVSPSLRPPLHLAVSLSSYTCPTGHRSEWVPCRKPMGIRLKTRPISSLFHFFHRVFDSSFNGWNDCKLRATKPTATSCWLHECVQVLCRTIGAKLQQRKLVFEWKRSNWPLHCGRRCQGKDAPVKLDAST